MGKVLFLNGSPGHVALLLKSPQHLSSTTDGHTGLYRHQHCSGRKPLWTASFMFLSTEPSGFSWFLQALPAGQHSIPWLLAKWSFRWKHTQHPSC